MWSTAEGRSWTWTNISAPSGWACKLLPQQRHRQPWRVRHPKHDGKFEAIAGVTLVKAAESLGWTHIRADILECDDKEAELWQALENFYRSELTALEQAEHLAVCVRRIAERESGQTAKKGKSIGGRPESVVTKTARNLPVPGKAQAARKKAIERGLRIAAMSPEVKTGILEAGLDGNQSALIEIAEQDTTEGQLAKIQEIAQAKPSSKAKGRNPWRRIGKTKRTKQSASKASLSPKDEGVLAKLIKAWKQAAEVKREFGKASQAVRDSFIERILRSASGDEGDTETELKPIQQDDQEMDGNDNDDLNDANDNDNLNDANENENEDNEQSNDDWCSSRASGSMYVPPLNGPIALDRLSSARRIRSMVR
jgi:ParB-like chromosome segregation protein Spo0J